MDFSLPSLLTGLVDRGNGLLWGSVLIYLLIGAGLYFTVRTGAIQVRYFGPMFKLLRGSGQRRHFSVSGAFDQSGRQGRHR